MIKTIIKIFSLTDFKKRNLILGILFSLFSTVASLTIPLILKSIVDSLVQQNFDSTPLFLLILIIVFNALFTGFSMYLLSKVGEQVVFSLRKKLWNKILKNKISFFESNQKGKLVSYIMNDTNKLISLFSTETAEFIIGIFTLIGTIFILIRIDLLLSLLIFVSIPIVIIIIIPLGKNLRAFSKNIQKETAKTSDFIIDNLSNIKLIKSSNMTHKEYHKGQIRFEQIYDKSLSSSRLQAILLPIISLIIMSTIIGIVFFGAFRVIKGAMTAGDLFAFIIYIIQFVTPLMTILTFWNKISSSSGSAEKLVDIFETTSENINNQGLDNVEKVKSISLNQVSYSNDGLEIIKDFSFTFHINNFYNLLGYSGAGKTTLFNLLVKFNLPSKGTLKLNGLSNFTINNWRKHISYISQDINLFNTTLRKNILYGVKKQYSDVEISEYLKELGLVNIIKKFPEGLDTIISKDSVKLSGGEKQRISLLRAVLSDKQILLVDEVSSNVDSKNDYLIYKFLKKYNTNRIIIMITHKLSNIHNEDTVVLLEKGRLVGSGRKDSLKENQLFKELQKYYVGVKNKN